MARPQAPEAPMAPPPTAPPPSPIHYDWLAALLTYMVPGLGQIFQGRWQKGLLYAVCLLGLFHYGNALGQGKHVWLADTSRLPEMRVPIAGPLSGLAGDLAYRKEFVGQFFIGAAAWPAVLQYLSTEPMPKASDQVVQPNEAFAPHPLFGNYMQAVPEPELNRIQANSNKLFDLGWVLTIIAGALNVLVISDALAGPLVRDEPKPPAEGGK